SEDTLSKRNYRYIEKPAHNKNNKHKYNRNFDCLEHLPIFTTVPLILQTLASSQVLIIEGSTGCGKSTQLPKLLLNFYNKIIVSEPRQIAAISLAERVSQETKRKLGYEVGFQVRFNENKTKDTRLLFVTDGMLLMKMESLNEGDVEIIIIDEAHERTLNTDVFIAYTKVLLKNKKLKLILMSATMTNSRLKSFFGCPVIVVDDKREYSKEIFYLENKIVDYISAAENTIMKILTNDFNENHSVSGYINDLCDLKSNRVYSYADELTPGFCDNKPLFKEGVLVFLPGIEDINVLYSCLKNAVKKLINSKTSENIEILKFHSKIPLKDIEKIFRLSENRKIILSTNISETSLTIPHLKYVIDCGFTKQNIFNYDTGTNFLTKMRISKSQAHQRSGRVGRLEKGVVFRLYTIDEFYEFEMNNKFEVFTQNLNELLLNVLRYKICLSDFIDLNLTKLCKSAKMLFYLGFINDKGLTKLVDVSCFLRPEYSLILIKAMELGVFKKAIKIVVVLTIEFSRIENAYIDAKDDFRACASIFDLHTKVEYKKFYDQIFNYFNVRYFSTALKYTESNFEARLGAEDRLDFAIASGLFLNTAIRKDNQFRNCLNDSIVVIPQSSILFKKNKTVENKVLLYDSVTVTKRGFINAGMFVDHIILNNITDLFKIVN
ncbi:putative pre-mRNA-splicing factor ATP-dependent RNA helicase dhx15, partial [Cucumispora dikerogammari]